MLVLDIGIFLAASLVLVKSASYAVKSISKIARHIMFSEFFTSFIIAGFISIMPEFFIGVNSALDGTPEIGLGTVIGSNIADLTIVIGLIAVAGRKINADTGILKNNFWFLLLTSLPVFFMLDGAITQSDGLFLVATFLVYLYVIIKRENIFDRNRPKSNSIEKNTIIFIASMIAMFLSSHYVVEAAANISLAMMVPAIIIGLFLVAIGTTLPELTFSLKAVMSHHKKIAFGDILGNVAIDSTLTIGIIAIIHPITTNLSTFAVSMFFMVFATLAIATMLKAEHRISWKEGLLLFVLYAIFAVIELGIGF